ncbi:MerR family transcriptional regulator [Nocardia mangyaensis]|uniref:MerR family transcriptional regulator n=1 Tax=Nocardia mangyaensis TaxID=2213200 RepID=UPI002674D7D3|nr:MerR family transcriptional regulator [Nocardia mangyaensis]MDO3650416.1 MerR family transcriptional regulator [Nocardia mangyaensis]
MEKLQPQVGRTVAVARASGYSAQQIRDLERDGVLPRADRTDGGHRVYRQIHLRSALAYRALAAGAGPVEAKRILRAVHAGEHGRALTLLDAVHAGLHTERVDLELAIAAAAAISTEPILDVRESDAMSIAELAAALGLPTSTLRHWDATDLVTPNRTPTGARHYSPAQVRDARIVHQLRRAGYRIPQLRAVLPQWRRADRAEDLHTALSARDVAITARSLALLEAAAALTELIRQDTPATS